MEMRFKHSRMKRVSLQFTQQTAVPTLRRHDKLYIGMTATCSDIWTSWSCGGGFDVEEISVVSVFLDSSAFEVTTAAAEEDSWGSMRRACGSLGRRKSIGLLCSSRTESPFFPLFSTCAQAAGVKSELPVQEVGSESELVVIPLGGNVGDRIQNLSRALECMRRAGIQVVCHACLYESAPVYVTDQPFFLNSAVAAVIKLSPEALLTTLKHIESDLSRTFGGLRYGPRPAAVLGPSSCPYGLSFLLQLYGQQCSQPCAAEATFEFFLWIGHDLEDGILRATLSPHCAVACDYHNLPT